MQIPHGQELRDLIVLHYLKKPTSHCTNYGIPQNFKSYFLIAVSYCLEMYLIHEPLNGTGALGHKYQNRNFSEGTTNCLALTYSI